MCVWCLVFAGAAVMDNPERKKPRKDDGDGGGSAGDSSVPLSKKARRKIAKTQRKLAAKRQQAGCIRRQVLGELRPLLTEAQVTELQKAPQTSEEDPTESATKVVPTSRAGKAGRARAVLNGDENVPTGRHAHRARGGRFVGDVPIDLRPIVDVLEKYEAQLRVERHPTLVARAMVPMDCHGTIDMAASVSSTVQQAEALAQPKLIDTAMCGTPNGSASQVLSLRSRGLRELKLSSLPLQHFATSTVPVTGLVSLDLSRNELWDLPRLHSLACLRSLNLSRNWFASLPQSLSDLPNLEELRVCHNMLRPSDNSLRVCMLLVLGRFFVRRWRLGVVTFARRPSWWICIHLTFCGIILFFASPFVLHLWPDSFTCQKLALFREAFLAHVLVP